MLKLTELTFRTDAQAREYVHEKYLKGMPDTEVDRIMSFYPDGGRGAVPQLFYRR